MRTVLSKLLPKRWRSDDLVIPVVRMQGAIGMTTPLRPSLTMAGLANVLEKAFGHKKAPAVAIIVNSPGGSPVQSKLIHTRIRQLAAEKVKNVLVFVEDVAASGGYMIALAGDEIIADSSSVVGSIGVVSAGFGFEKAIDKLGIERRVYTAGERKAILDPFRPENVQDVEHLKALQAEIHADFVNLAKERRGAALSDDDSLFSGLFWTGTRARELGLVDTIGDLRSVLKERFGDKAKAKLIAPERGFLMRRPSGLGSSALTSQLVDGGLAALEERALWARYGL